ncbi:MAG: RNA polymerase sigma-70 factor [Polyangiaceae bacterium]|nr:RNA polymerase sigma-70 factor [Polyangiaceae bacterium]
MAHDWAQAFDREREHLFAVAYRMLGSATEADDVIQEAWLRVQGSEAIPRSERAMLTTVVVRLCLDVLKSARARRETYVGPWLPEPVAGWGTAPGAGDDTPERRYSLRESVTLGLLVVLESLSPLERAAFLLREVFEWDFAEIAAALGRSEVACRKLHQRAQGHVEARHSRFETSEEAATRLAHAFMLAVASGDRHEVAKLLADDAIATSDGGGIVKSALRPIYGARRVASFFVGLTKKLPIVPTVEPAVINGEVALLVLSEGKLTNLISLSVDGERIRAIRWLRNPEKLARLARSL